MAERSTIFSNSSSVLSPLLCIEDNEDEDNVQGVDSDIHVVDSDIQPHEAGDSDNHVVDSDIQLHE
jgi:hypothetical protein